jgi:hypothetical protein
MQASAPAREILLQPCMDLTDDSRRFRQPEIRQQQGEGASIEQRSPR